MSKSGYFHTSGSHSRSLLFSWSVSSQSVDKNQTTIKWSLKGDGGSSTSWVMAGNFKVVINGSTVYRSSTRIKLYKGKTIASGTFKISHGSDGSKSFTVKAEAGIYNVAVNCSGSATWALPTIARATKPTVNKNTICFGDEIKISLPRASSSFTHTIQAGVDRGIKFHNIATKVGTSHRWRLPKSWAEYITSADMKLRIRVYTYKGSTYVGSHEVSPQITVKATDDMAPSLDISLSDEKGLYEKYGGFVRGQSKIKAKILEQLYKGAKVKTRSLTINGLTYQANEHTTDTITTTSQSIAASVKDSRNMTSTKTVKPKVFDWYAPKLYGIKIGRANSDGTVNDTGGYAKIVFRTDIAPINGDNKKTLKIAYKQQNANVWSYETIVLNSFTQTITTLIPADGENSWDIQIIVSDDFKTITASETVDTVYVLLDFHKSGKGIAVGKVSEHENMLEVNRDWKIRIHGKEILDYVYPIGSIYLSTSHISPETLFGGKWQQLQNRFLLGAGSHYANGHTGGESTHKLSVDELPKHSHDTPFFNNMDKESKNDFVGVFGKGMTVSQALKQTGKSSTIEMWWKDQFNTAEGSEHSYRTSSTGSNKAHNNMPPYIVVNMWKRIE